LDCFVVHRLLDAVRLRQTPKDDTAFRAWSN
jgi:hypothetical protein